MDQEELEKKVRQLLEDQGFEAREIDNGFSIRENQQEVFKALVFSSQKYAENEIREIEFDEGSKVFVDEKLSSIKEQLENEVSIIKEYSSKDYDLPSFELIGDIAEINDLAGRNKEEAVEGILEYHDVKTVLLKTEDLSGEYRVGNYEKLYGEETETIHKEHGHRIKVDPTKTYYSERFSTERKRVADQVKEGENVLIMFAGVGPFAMLCGEKAEKVVAIEKNPDAFKYLKENIELNKLEDKIDAHEGDVREITPELNQKFDRVVMPLPGSAIEFLGTAIDSISRNSVIHLYSFVEEENFEPVISRIREIFDKKDVEYEVINKVQCGYKSPSEDRYCFDIIVK